MGQFRDAQAEVVALRDVGVGVVHHHLQFQLVEAVAVELETHAVELPQRPLLDQLALPSQQLRVGDEAAGGPPHAVRALEAAQRAGHAWLPRPADRSFLAGQAHAEQAVGHLERLGLQVGFLQGGGGLVALRRTRRGPRARCSVRAPLAGSSSTKKAIAADLTNCRFSSWKATAESWNGTSFLPSASYRRIELSVACFAGNSRV